MQIILAVVYGVFISFIVWYAVFAQAHFDGDIDNAYTKGMQYPAELAKRQTLGWQFQHQQTRSVDQQKTQLTLSIQAEQQPIEHATVIMTVSRPGSQETLAPLTAQEVAPGQYQLEAVLPAAGHWQVAAEIKHQETQLMHTFRVYTQDT